MSARVLVYYSMPTWDSYIANVDSGCNVPDIRKSSSKEITGVSLQILFVVRMVPPWVGNYYLILGYTPKILFLQ